MKASGLLLALTVFLAAVVVGQTQAPATPSAPTAAAAPQQQGPGIQAPSDARYQEWVTGKCKGPPQGRAAGARGGAAASRPAHRELSPYLCGRTACIR